MQEVTAGEVNKTGCWPNGERREEGKNREEVEMSPKK